MHIRWRSWFYPKLGIEVWKKYLIQKSICLSNSRNIVFSEFFYKSILERLIHSLYSSFPLRRVSKYKLYSKLFAYSSKLCGKLMIICGIGMIDLVGRKSIEIDGLWFSMIRRGHILSPESIRWPESFTIIKTSMNLFCCIIHTH